MKMPLSLPSAGRSRAGFTLIEIMLGLALMSILMGGIFAVQRGALAVSTAVVERETQTLKVHAFCELLRRNFEQVPGNARVNLQFFGGSGSDLTEVAFSDYPLAFTWPGITAGSTTVIFRTERSSTGLGLQASLLYLDKEQAAEWQKGQFDDSKVLKRVSIMDGIAFLGWQFFNETTQEWETEWPLTNTRRPTFVEMTLQFMDGEDPVKLVFWIPTMANPQQFTSGFGGAAQNPQVPGGGGGPAGGGGGPGAGPGGGGPNGGGGGPGGGGGGPRGGGGGGGGPRGGGSGRPLGAPGGR